jgi:phage antirepressor YoqD-like protein
MESNKVFAYKGQPVTFQATGSNYMVDANQMARPFGKRPANWLATGQAQELIASLSAKTGIPVTGLITVRQGGNAQGTWMHEDVALLFAQWLSPEFYLWCNDRIKELMRHGITATPDTILAILQEPDTLIELLTNLKDERAMRHRAESEAATLRPKAQLMDKVLCSDEQIDVGQAAKILGLPYGRNTLFRKLRELGIFFKYRNEPKQEYVNRGLFKLREKWIEPNNHDGFTVLKVLVTQPGLSFLAELLSNHTNAGHEIN